MIEDAKGIRIAGMVTETDSIRSKRNREKAEPSGIRLRERLTYGDACLYVILLNPVMFSEFFFPRERTQLSPSKYIWNRTDGASVWLFQYPFLLWSRGVYCCGKNIGKSVIGLTRKIMWRLIRWRNWEFKLAAPSDQHARKIYDAVTQHLDHNRYLLFWQSVRKGNITGRERQITTPNGCRFKALLPGIRGRAFKGERGTALDEEETQDIPWDGQQQLTEVLEKPVNYDEGSEHRKFGVPDGDRTSPFYFADTSDNSFDGFRRKIPSYLPPTVGWDDFKRLLDQNQCQYQDIIENGQRRIVVEQWSNNAVQTMQGQWGEPSTACFPVYAYEFCVHKEPYSKYRHITLTRAHIRQEENGVINYARMVYAIQQMGNRENLPDVESVIVSIDPGISEMAIEIWVRRNIQGESANRWWLIGRQMMMGIENTNAQLSVVKEIIAQWHPEIVALDASSANRYLFDMLAADDPNHYIQVMAGKESGALERLRTLPAPSQSKPWLMGFSFAGKIPVGINLETRVFEEEMVDIKSVRIIQDMMSQRPTPYLALPAQSQDPDFYAEFTSYRENVTSSGKRFSPDHPHVVSAAKVFAAAEFIAYQLAAKIVIPMQPVEIDDPGMYFSRTGF